MSSKLMARRVLPLLLIALSCRPSFAQTVSIGPTFEEGGFYLFQFGMSDSAYDPYEVLWNFDYRVDPPQREAIVDFRMNVNLDGRVENLRVLGGFYDQGFLDKAKEQVAQLEFVPAHSEKGSISWPAFDLRLILRGMYLPGLRQEFRPDLERLIRLMKGEEFEKAERFIFDLLESKAAFLFEYALLQDYLAALYLATDRPYLALIASRNATEESKAIVDVLYTESRIRLESSRYPNEYLSPAEYLDALRKRFTAATMLNQTGELLDVFSEIESRAALGGRNGLTEELRPVAEKVRALLETKEPVSSLVKLVNGKWVFHMSNRRVFGATGLTGQVNFIDFNCERLRKQRIPFQNNTEWNVPPSWGDCSMEFLGEDGSQFYLIEYLD